MVDREYQYHCCHEFLNPWQKRQVKYLFKDPVGVDADEVRIAKTPTVSDDFLLWESEVL